MTPERRTERLYKATYTSRKPCNIRRESTYHNNPKEKSDIKAEKTAINDREDYAYRGAINDRRYYADGGARRYYNTQTEEPSPTDWTEEPSTGRTDTELLSTL